MVLLLDLGNTNLYVGVYRDDKLLYDYRTYSDVNKSSDEYKAIIKEFLQANDLHRSDFEGAILSSVIPSLTLTICNSIEKLFGFKCMVVGNKLKTGLSIRIDNPSELGSDLVCDAIGAKHRYGTPVLIADLGTASKIMAVDKNGNFVGVTISPGINLSMKALSNGAAQLMDVSLIAPESIIGKNSADSINSGLIYGTIAMVEGLCEKIEKEFGYNFKRVLTGGYAEIVKNHIDKRFMFDADLILEGLYQIYLKNVGENK